MPPKKPLIPDNGRKLSAVPRPRTSGTWDKNSKVDRSKGGRPKRSKDKVPRGVRGSILAIAQHIATNNPEVIRKALINGFAARPPHSFPYLQLVAAYIDGRPAEKLEIAGRMEVQYSQAAQAFKERLTHLATLRQVRALPEGSVVEGTATVAPPPLS